MRDKTIDNLIKSMPEKSNFYYFKDRFALMVLSYFVESGMKIKDIKKTKVGKLLNKPIVKNIINQCGNGILTRGDLDSYWPPIPECYLLTIGKWGNGTKNKYWQRSWYQTSRPGLNLVLQLNFSSKHNKEYQKLINPGNYHPFQYYSHPVRKDNFNTLSWARIDIDFDYDEAIIEEIQTDWIRIAKNEKVTIEKKLKENEMCFEEKKKMQNIIKYMDNTLNSHLKLWDEATMAASIWFLKEVTGIGKIFYHTYESGNKLKGLGNHKPPKSLYKTLPEKFAFRLTENVPLFLKAQKRFKKEKTNNLQFYVMN